MHTNMYIYPKCQLAPPMSQFHSLAELHESILASANPKHIGLLKS